MKKEYRMKRHLYKRKGSCRRCGRCCQVRYLLKGSPFLFKIILFIIQPKLLYGWITKDKCPYLDYISIDDKHYNDTAFICKIYPNRPWFCKGFPGEPGDLIDNKCGFRFKERK